MGLFTEPIKSTDEGGCPSCGASYKENLDLRVAEEEERVERMHYEEYMYLRDLEWEQNKRNEARDRHVDTKYAKPIAFMMTDSKHEIVSVFTKQEDI